MLGFTVIQNLSIHAVLFLTWCAADALVCLAWSALSLILPDRTLPRHIREPTIATHDSASLGVPRVFERLRYVSHRIDCSV